MGGGWDVGVTYALHALAVSSLIIDNTILERTGFSSCPSNIQEALSKDAQSLCTKYQYTYCTCELEAHIFSLSQHYLHDTFQGSLPHGGRNIKINKFNNTTRLPPNSALQVLKQGQTQPNRTYLPLSCTCRTSTSSLQPQKGFGRSSTIPVQISPPA